MDDFTKFLEVNEIKQKEIAEYLGVSAQSIGQMAKGKIKLPRQRLKQIKENPFGWDTSMLAEPQIVQTIGSHSSNNTQVTGVTEKAVLEERIRCLERLLEEKERTIQILMQK